MLSQVLFVLANTLNIYVRVIKEVLLYGVLNSQKMFDRSTGGM